MSFTPSFVAAQSPVSPNIIVVADTSVGSDGAIVSRKVYLRDYAGNYLVPEGVTTTFTPWALVDSTINLDVLTTDMSLQCTVEWCNSGGTALYTSSDRFCFALYNKQFAFQLIQGLTPPITLDNGYSNNLANLWTNIIGAINAIEIASNLTASQACLNRASYLRTHQNLFF